MKIRKDDKYYGHFVLDDFDVEEQKLLLDNIGKPCGLNIDALISFLQRKGLISRSLNLNDIDLKRLKSLLDSFDLVLSAVETVSRGQHELNFKAYKYDVKWLKAHIGWVLHDDEEEGDDK